MTDHLSIIRQVVRRLRLDSAGDAARGGLPPQVSADINDLSLVLAACDALEAERLTPEEARLTLAMFNTLAATYTLKGGYATTRAKLERIAGAEPTSIRAMIDGEE